MKTYEHFINGEYRSSSQTFETVNPATGQTVGEAARGTRADIDSAVVVAADTFHNTPWADLDGCERGQLRRRCGIKRMSNADCRMSEDGRRAA